MWRYPDGVQGRRLGQRRSQSNDCRQANGKSKSEFPVQVENPRVAGEFLHAGQGPAILYCIADTGIQKTNDSRGQIILGPPGQSAADESNMSAA